MNCKECDGAGRWYDASHGASRRCKTCNGTGKAPKSAQGNDSIPSLSAPDRQNSVTGKAKDEVRRYELPPRMGGHHVVHIDDYDALLAQVASLTKERDQSRKNYLTRKQMYYDMRTKCRALTAANEGLASERDKANEWQNKTATENRRIIAASEALLLLLRDCEYHLRDTTSCSGALIHGKIVAALSPTAKGPAAKER